LGTVPILSSLQGVTSPLLAFALIAAAWLFTAGYTSINAIVKAELFPTHVRATGVGLPYALTVSIFGGTAPVVALAFKEHHHEAWFYYYLAGMICVSLVIYATMRDTKRHSAFRADIKDLETRLETEAGASCPCSLSSPTRPIHPGRFDHGF
jgi:MFS transporter, MHS family, alpha-ketoglutarate permease